MDIYSKAEAELNSIDQQIAELQRRQVELRQFVNLGRKLFDATPVQGSLVFPPKPATEQSLAAHFATPARARDGSMKARILETAELLIQGQGPLHTKDLVDHLETCGVEIGGADKTVTVGVILSRSSRFKADRKVGWSLSPDWPFPKSQSKENPQDAPTSAGSSAA